MSDFVVPYLKDEHKPFSNVSERVKESHLKYMLKHAPQIAKVLNLEITELPNVNTGETEKQFVKMKDKSTKKFWYLFTLATLMSKRKLSRCYFFRKKLFEKNEPKVCPRTRFCGFQ